MGDSYKLAEDQDQQEHLLDDLEYTYTQAGADKRFGNYLIDRIAFLRSLSRLVPFEPFSALKKPSYPWHDRWTRTLVIVEKLSNLPPES
jgi:hypothetical protein